MKLLLDLPALERLLGGDSKVELELRQGVVETFARKHLKAIAKSEALQPYLEQTKEAVVEAVKQEIPLVRESYRQDYRHRHRWVFDEKQEFGQELVEAVRHHAKKLALEVVKDRVGDVWDELRTEAFAHIDKMAARLERQVKEEVGKRIDSKFEQMVQAEVNRRIRAAAQGGVKP